MPVPFKLPRFYPILDTATLQARSFPVLKTGEALLAAGIKILQYRHKDDWTQQHFDDAKNLAQRCQDAGVLFVLNDRADFACLLRTALHLGQNDLPPVAARRIISDEVMGFSTHNRSQMKRAEEEPVEYLSIGPIFPTQSKLRPDPVVGLESLRECRKLTPKPLVAIGGITLDNALETLEAKADSLAILSGFLPDEDRPKDLRRRVDQWLTLLA